MFLLSEGEYSFRRSTEADHDAIVELVTHRFGDRLSSGYNKYLEGRYLLGFHGDLLVSMTGLNDSKAYNGLEVDWTCVRQGYEGKDLIVKSFEVLLEDVTCPVYASCVRLPNKSYVNLHRTMERFGFYEVVNMRVRYDSNHNNCCNDCKFYAGGHCTCCEDLYRRGGAHA